MPAEPTPEERGSALDRLIDAHPVRAGVLGESPAARRLLGRLRRLAASMVPVLVRGEVGAGKEAVARAVHLNSPRATGPFVVEAGATLADPLARRLMIGHRRGAFTGAISNVPGLLEAADGGTLYLDEVADIPLEAQGWLVHLVQDAEYRPLGAAQSRRADVRLVTSSTHDLRALVATGRFRRDLYFRIRGGLLAIPPLRERPADVVPIAERILEEDARRRAVATVRLDPSARTALTEHTWPGNVRELRHELLTAAALADDGVVRADRFQFVGEPPPEEPARAPRPAPLRRRLHRVERTAIDEALRQAGGNKAEAARRLGLTRRTLYRRLAAMRDDPAAS